MQHSGSEEPSRLTRYILEAATAAAMPISRTGSVDCSEGGALLDGSSRLNRSGKYRHCRTDFK